MMKKVINENTQRCLSEIDKILESYSLEDIQPDMLIDKGINK